MLVTRYGRGPKITCKRCRQYVKVPAVADLGPHGQETIARALAEGFPMTEQRRRQLEEDDPENFEK